MALFDSRLIAFLTVLFFLSASFLADGVARLPQ